jgi:hypothetical protein
MALSAFEPRKLGPLGQQGIAQFLPQTWVAHVPSSPEVSPWDPAAAIPALGRTMCALVREAATRDKEPYPLALAVFLRGRHEAGSAAEIRAAADVRAFVDLVLQHERHYGKDPRLTPPPPAASPPPAAPPLARPTPRPTATQQPPAAPPPPAVALPPSRPVAAMPARYGPFYIRNQATRWCVDRPGLDPQPAGTLVGQYVCKPDNRWGHDNQEWWFEPVKQVDRDGFQLYLIRNSDDMFCIDPPEQGPMPPGTKLFAAQCSAANDNQLWRIEPRYVQDSRGFVWLRNAASMLCLDVPGVRANDLAAQLELYECRSNDDHDWALVHESTW